MKTFRFCFALAAGLWTVSTVVAQGQYYHFGTIAGSVGHGFSDGTNSVAQFYLPGAVAADRAGNLWVADTYNDVIRQITPAGVVMTIAGSPQEIGCTDGLGHIARFVGPGGIAVDSATNIYVADTYAHTIRKLTPSGTNWVVTTFAGLAGCSGSNDGTGCTARFYSPQGLAVDSANNVYVADFGNHTIRRITPAGDVMTLAGSAGASGSDDGTGTNARFTNPHAVAVDAEGGVYVADFGNNTIRQVIRVGAAWEVRTIAGVAGSNGSGSVDGANTAARFSGPKGIIVDTARKLYVTDSGNHTIRQIILIGADWVTTTLAGQAMASGSDDGLGSTARFCQPGGVTVDSGGAIYIADAGNSTIRKIILSSTAASVSTLAGSVGGEGSADGPGPAARFQFPGAVAVDTTGNLYVSDIQNHTIRQIRSSANEWSVTTIAGLAEVSGSADGKNSNARFWLPKGVTVDATGALYVADGNDTIRQIAQVGGAWEVTTIAGVARYYGSADGAGSNARFRSPSAITADRSGNLYVADTQNNTIRKLTRSANNWVVSTLAGSATAGWGKNVDGVGAAARFSEPQGIAVDDAGVLYVADSWNNTLRQVSQTATGWVVITISGDPSYADSMGFIRAGYADGTNTQARFNNPGGMAVDSAGNLYVADVGNQVIRKLTRLGPDWVVSTIGGLAGFDGSDDGTSSEARFWAPWAVVPDTAGNLYVADSANQLIRMGQPTSVAPAPVKITYSASQLMIFGSLTTTNSILESATSLAPGATWVPVAGGATRFGNTLILPRNPSVPAAFFRIRSR